MKRQGRSKGTAAEEMQAVYAKESEVLTKNIGSEPLRRNNVVLGHENLKMIAILHESMVGSRKWVWLVAQVPPIAYYSVDRKLV